MLTIFERYLFRQFLYINAIYFCVILGLFTIIDLFDNVDDFLVHGDGNGAFGIAARIVLYYSRQGMLIFDTASIPLIAISVLTAILLLKKNGQVKPFLSAGVPTYRIITPALLLGVSVMMCVKIVNREVFLSDAGHYQHASRGSAEKTLHLVVPKYDHASQILIDGWAVYPEEKRIEKTAFLLPPDIAGNDMINLQAAEAKFYPQKGKYPSGWLLKDVHPRPETIPLTQKGKKYIKRTRQPDNVYVVSEIGPDLIYKANGSSRFLSTTQLVSRINSPAIDANAARGLEFDLHMRLVEPILAGMMIVIAIPIILERESRGLILSAGKCGFWLFIILASTYVVRFLPSLQISEPVQAAWLPLFFVVPFAIWMLDTVET